MSNTFDNNYIIYKNIQLPTNISLSGVGPINTFFQTLNIPLTLISENNNAIYSIVNISEYGFVLRNSLLQSFKFSTNDKTLTYLKFRNQANSIRIFSYKMSDNNFEITAPDIKRMIIDGVTYYYIPLSEIGLGMQKTDTYILNENESNFKQLIEWADIDKNNLDNETHFESGVDSSLTKLGRYYLKMNSNNYEQAHYVTYPKTIEEIDSPNFIFKNPQQYNSTINSKNAKYWATNTAPYEIEDFYFQVIYDGIDGINEYDTEEHRIDNITDQSFIFDGNKYYKPSNAKLMLIKRESTSWTLDSIEKNIIPYGNLRGESGLLVNKPFIGYTNGPRYQLDFHFGTTNDIVTDDIFTATANSQPLLYSILNDGSKFSFSNTNMTTGHFFNLTGSNYSNLQKKSTNERIIYFPKIYIKNNYTKSTEGNYPSTIWIYAPDNVTTIGLGTIKVKPIQGIIKIENNYYPCWLDNIPGDINQQNGNPIAQEPNSFEQEWRSDISKMIQVINVTKEIQPLPNGLLTFNGWDLTSNHNYNKSMANTIIGGKTYQGFRVEDRTADGNSTGKQIFSWGYTNSNNPLTYAYALIVIWRKDGKEIE